MHEREAAARGVGERGLAGRVDPAHDAEDLEVEGAPLRRQDAGRAREVLGVGVAGAQEEHEEPAPDQVGDGERAPVEGRALERGERALLARGGRPDEEGYGERGGGRAETALRGHGRAG